MADFTKLNGYTVKDPYAVHTYDTVDDLKGDTKLKAGDNVKTKGYTAIGDGGYAEYIIVDDNTLIGDDGGVIALSNGLFAILIVNDGIITDAQFSNILSAFAYCVENEYKLHLTKDHSIIEDGCEMPSIEGNGCTITYGGTGLITNGKTIKGVNFVWDTSSTGYEKQNGLRSTSSTIEDCTFTGFVSPCKIMGNNPKVTNCKFVGTAQGVYVSGASNAVVNNISFINTDEERTAWRTALSSNNGMDGVLVENSNNVVISNSYFKYCTERILYSTESDNVDIHNIKAEYCNGIKFVGYTEIRHNFNANNIVLHNSFDDAFCQLYMCEDVNITDCYFNGDDEPNYIGWFIRAGHHVANVNVTGNKVSLVRRSFVTYQDTFPDTIEDHDYVFANINVTNNFADRMSLIANLHYPAIDIQDPSNQETHTIEKINICNNTFYGLQFDNKTTYYDGAKTLSTFIHCLNGNDFTILNNDVKGINKTSYKIPCVELGDVTNVRLKMDVYESGIELNGKTFTRINGNAEITEHYNNTAPTSLEQNGITTWIIVNNIVQGVFNIKYVNRSIWLEFPNFDIYGQVFNVDELNTFANNSATDTKYVTGTKISTTLGNTENYIYFYTDNSIVLRTRSNRTLNITGNLSGVIGD